MADIPIDYESLVQYCYEAILRDGDIAIDVGAHVGRHTIPMAKCVFPSGKVVAFEPLPSCRQTLDKELAGQHQELADLVTIVGDALGNTSGPAEFVVAADALGYSGLRERRYDWPTRLERIPVQVERLDDLFLDLPSLRYIKIDAEGGELDILRGGFGCLEKFRPVVGFEFGANAIGAYQMTPADMADFWEAAGYHVYAISGKRLGRREFVQSALIQSSWDYLAVPAEEVELQERLREVLARPRIDWSRLTTLLQRAEAHACMGKDVPSFAHFRGPLRMVARWTARLVLYLARFVTGPQRAYNLALVQAIQSLSADLRRMEQEWTNRACRLGELECLTQQLQEELASLRPQSNLMPCFNRGARDQAGPRPVAKG